ncbi:hypothetical protein Dimus_025922, partial [Dionaea muscipula]
MTNQATGLSWVIVKKRWSSGIGRVGPDVALPGWKDLVEEHGMNQGIPSDALLGSEEQEKDR